MGLAGWRTLVQPQRCPFFPPLSSPFPSPPPPPTSQLVSGLGGSGLAMPVEVVQFCWKYTLTRLQNLPEVAGCEVRRERGRDGQPDGCVDGGCVGGVGEGRWRAGWLIAADREWVTIVRRAWGSVEGGCSVELALRSPAASQSRTCRRQCPAVAFILACLVLRLRCPGEAG